MKCENCIFWVEANGTKKEDNIGGCTFGVNNYYPMFLNEECSLIDLHKGLAKEINDKVIREEVIKKTSFIKIYHGRSNDDVWYFDLAFADYDTTVSEIKSKIAKEYNLPEYEVIVTFLYGEDDYDEISLCTPLSKLLK